MGRLHPQRPAISLIRLAFTIAGYNLDRVRSYRAKKRPEAEAKPAQPQRRGGTWNDVVYGPVATQPTETPPDT
jgi:hypothetical protein